MSKNPYVEKFSKAFNLGLAGAVFLALVVIAACSPKSAYAVVTGDLPVTCFSTEEFVSEYNAGNFEILNNSVVTVFVDGDPQRVEKVITQAVRQGETIQGLWLVEKTGKFCLVYLENLGKVKQL